MLESSFFNIHNMIYNSILETVGNTPAVKINNLALKVLIYM